MEDNISDNKHTGSTGDSIMDIYYEPFKDVVLKHLHSMPSDEWQRLRAYAANHAGNIHHKDIADLSMTPESLFDVALSEDGISVDDVLSPGFRLQAVEIGEIEGQPVRYITGQGIYLWGLNPKHRLSLSFWITHPAYPPNW